MKSQQGHHVFLLVLAATMTLATRAPAQECPQISMDSALTKAGPVYQACEVETPAQRKGLSPATSYRLSDGQNCVAAIVDFVVEVDGKVGVGSGRVVRTNDEVFARQMLRRLERARYTPAQKGGAPVRQLVRDTLSIRMREVAAVPGTSGSSSSFEPPCL